MVISSPTHKLPQDSLFPTLENIFGNEYSKIFLEIVATSLLGNNIDEFPELKELCLQSNHSDWFQAHYGFEQFDYIILVARKGSSSFRAFLPALKYYIKNKALRKRFKELADKVIITNTRSHLFYCFNECKNNDGTQKDIKDLKILIFDDLLAKGRNITRIAISLFRRGFSPDNIYYTAFGYHEMQKFSPNNNFGMSDQVASISPAPNENNCKTGNRYVVNIHSREIAKLIEKKRDELPDNEKSNVEKYKRIPLFLPHSLSKRDFFLSGLFHAKPKMNEMSYSFNKFFHYCSVPYTGYTSYVYFGFYDIFDQENLFYKSAYTKLYGAKSDFQNMYPKITCWDMFHLNKVKACNDMRIDCRLFVRNNEDKSHNYKNGYFTCVQTFYNGMTNEILLYPFICLPALTETQVCTLYVALFGSAFECNTWRKENEMMVRIYDFAKSISISDTSMAEEYYKKIPFDFTVLHDSTDEFNIPDALKRKHICETMIRSILMILSAIEGVKFAKDYSLFIQDNPNESQKKAIEMFAKNISRYLRGHRRGERYESSIQDCELLLSTCYNTVLNSKSKELFDFHNTDKYGDYWPKMHDTETGWMKYFDGYEHDRNGQEILKKVVSAFTLSNDIPDNMQYRFGDVSHLTDTDKDDPHIYLSDIVLILSDMDESEPSKIPPLPTLEVIRLAMSVFEKHSSHSAGAVSKEDLFVKFMISLQELTEDGSANLAVYAEGKRLGNNIEEFLCFSGLQCGEMSMHAAHWLLCEYGGWDLVNELRSICIERLLLGKSNDNILNEIDTPLHNGLLTMFQSSSDIELENIKKVLKSKLHRLFSTDSFVTRVMYAAPSDDVDNAHKNELVESLRWYEFAD